MRAPVWSLSNDTNAPNLTLDAKFSLLWPCVLCAQMICCKLCYSMCDPHTVLPQFHACFTRLSLKSTENLSLDASFSSSCLSCTAKALCLHHSSQWQPNIQVCLDTVIIMLQDYHKHPNSVQLKQSASINSNNVLSMQGRFQWTAFQFPLSNFDFKAGISVCLAMFTKYILA